MAQTPEEAGYQTYDGSEEAVSTNEPTIKLLSHGSVLPSTGKMDLLFSSCGYVKASNVAYNVLELEHRASLYLFPATKSLFSICREKVVVNLFTQSPLLSVM